MENGGQKVSNSNSKGGGGEGGISKHGAYLRRSGRGRDLVKVPREQSLQEEAIRMEIAIRELVQEFGRVEKCGRIQQESEDLLGCQSLRHSQIACGQIEQGKSRVQGIKTARNLLLRYLLSHVIT